ncbi:MAG: hypothetical protein H0X38_16070 [Planctomycetes bacterium]|nr:hypothetical protein [Planctomycetota bacterium]
MVALPGSVVAARETGIHARSGGFVSAWNVDMAETVTADQLLAVIDAPEMKRKLDQTLDAPTVPAEP